MGGRTVIGGVTTLAANQQALTDAVHEAGIVRCKLLGNGMALQSFRDAMAALCAAPASGDRAADRRRRAGDRQVAERARPATR